MTDALLAQFQRLLEEIRALRDLQGLPTILTKKRAARELGVSLSKLKALIRTGEIAICGVGRTSMVPASEVRRIAASARREAAPPARPARARKAKHAGAAEEASAVRAALKKR